MNVSGFLPPELRVGWTPEAPPYTQGMISNISSIKHQLESALASSSRAERVFGSVGFKSEWFGSGGVRDAFGEASRDTVEIDSSQFGQAASAGLSELSGLQSELSRLTQDGTSAQSDTVSSLSSALTAAKNLNAPAELQSAIERALRAAQSADRSADTASSESGGLASDVSDMSDSARTISGDEAPDEYGGGEDVSYYGDSGVDSVGRADDRLREINFASGEAVGDHKVVQSEARQALSLVDEVGPADVTGENLASTGSSSAALTPGTDDSSEFDVTSTGVSSSPFPSFAPATSLPNPFQAMQMQQMNHFIMQQRLQQMALLNQARLTSMGFF